MTKQNEMAVHTDEFRVSRGNTMLLCELSAALAVCVHDDTQGAGGLLHLRYVANGNEHLPEVTDNTLSSDLLLMDRFCKELRRLGARKQTWRVQVIAHTPETPEFDHAAATVVDLVKAYFGDGRFPVETQTLRNPLNIALRFDAREGRIWAHAKASKDDPDHRALSA